MNGTTSTTVIMPRSSCARMWQCMTYCPGEIDEAAAHPEVARRSTIALSGRVGGTARADGIGNTSHQIAVRLADVMAVLPRRRIVRIEQALQRWILHGPDHVFRRSRAVRGRHELVRIEDLRRSGTD